jgi:heme/copper-type cytochrome/quinol oxidase subunit 2
VLALITGFLTVSTLQRSPEQHPLRAFDIFASHCAFAPNQIVVDLGDRVRITFWAEDAPHALVIETYGIFRRAVPGHNVAIDFLADRPGVFPFYSILATDAACIGMRGELIVRARSESGAPR